MSESKTIVKYGSIYAAANLINRSAGLILIPLYTHALTPAQYGIYAMVQTVTDIVGLFVGMGFAKAMARFYFEYTNDQTMRDKVVSTTILGFVGVGALLILAAYPLAYVITNFIFSGTEYATLFAFALAGLVFTLLFEIQVDYYVMKKEAMSYLALATSKAVLMLAINVLLVLHFKLGVYGIIYSLALTMGILTLVSGTVVLKRTGLGFSFSLFRDLARFGIPLVPSAISNTAIAFTSRYFLNSLAGPAAVGMYALADRLSSLMQMFIAAPFSQIFLIRRFETLSQGEDQQVFHRILLVFVSIMCCAALFLSLFSNEILTIIAPHAYQSAVQLIPLLALCYVLSSVNLNVELGLLYQKSTWAVSLIAFVTLAISVPSNYFFIEKYGAIGAAYAYILISVVRLGLTALANRSIGSPLVRLDWPRAIAMMAIATGLGVVLANESGAQIGWIAVKLAIFAGFVALLATTPLLDRASRRQIATLLRRKS